MPLEVTLPSKLEPVFTARNKRYRGAWGGRGSGKSASFAQMLLVDGMQAPHKILCAREIQNSIRESVHAEITGWVENIGLGWFY
jgi:phage terminase large subunit